MKAGIYLTPSGNLIYVAKDRTIKATNLSPSSWPGMKVKTMNDGALVVIPVGPDGKTGYACHRVADVPNGCTDPQAELARCRGRLYSGDLTANVEAFGGVDAIPVDKIEPTVRKAADEMHDIHETKKPRLSGRATQLLLQEGRSEETIRAMDSNMLAKGAIHVAHDEYMLPEGAGKSGFATGGFVGLGPNEVPAILSRGQCLPHVSTTTGKMSGGPLSSNLNRTEEKTARLAAGTQSGAPEAWRNVKNAGQYNDLQFEMERVAMQAKGFRLCHGQSARKHRKQGDTVLPSDNRPGAHWWRHASTQRTVKINVRGHVFDTPAAI